MGHLAAYLSHDEGDRDGQGADRKNQHGFRNFARQHFREKVNEGGIGNAHCNRNNKRKRKRQTRTLCICWRLRLMLPSRITTALAVYYDRYETSMYYDRYVTYGTEESRWHFG